VAEFDAAELATFYADYVDAWNRRDLDSYFSLYSADLVFRDGSTVLHGIDALRSRYEAELREFPDLILECVRLFVDAESQAIAAENIERGTDIELRGALFLTLAEGQISEIAEICTANMQITRGITIARAPGAVGQRGARFERVPRDRDRLRSPGIRGAYSLFVAQRAGSQVALRL
jgi:hypothetical protein